MVQTEQERKAILGLLQDYNDFTAWSYELKMLWNIGDCAQHYFYTKLQTFSTETWAKKCLNRTFDLGNAEMFDAKIIFQMRHSTRVENLVPMQKNEWWNQVVCGY
jgi:hypothetical protein